ncbi:MAG: glutathione S-transferase family protein [Proteobacteria bacterium]|nr:glutathione S-transferase family protein [Pseudomonadota bacterium]
MSEGRLNATRAPYRFHAFDVSYFSAKVRPALRYKTLWYEERRADMAEIQRRTGLGFIPILVTPEDETWQDTSEILDRLEERHPDPPLIPVSPVQRLAALRVELYADEFGVGPAMHYRWGTADAEASARARFTAMIGNAEFGRRAAATMSSRRGAVGASDASGPAIEAHSRDLLAALSAHFEAHPYLLGARMSLADCALMGPLYGHFFNDLGSRRLLLETAVPVVGWIERCNFPGADQQGEWLADDALSETLSAVLAVMGRDAVPILVACLRQIEEWADSRDPSEDAVPRAVGTARAELWGAPFERAAIPYTLWMVQRALDHYRGLSDPERERVDKVVAGSGWEALLAYTPRHRLTKRGFALTFA